MRVSLRIPPRFPVVKLCSPLRPPCHRPSRLYLRDRSVTPPAISIDVQLPCEELAVAAAGGFRSVKELGVVPLAPPNSGLLERKRQVDSWPADLLLRIRSYLAPREASDAASGVDDAPKPLGMVDEIFESVLVKYVDGELSSSVFSFEASCPNAVAVAAALLKPKPFCLN